MANLSDISLSIIEINIALSFECEINQKLIKRDKSLFLSPSSLAG